MTNNTDKTFRYEDRLTLEAALEDLQSRLNEARFGLITNDTAKLRTLLGDRPKLPKLKHRAPHVGWGL